MKTNVTICLAMVCLSPLLCSAGEKPATEAVVVKALELPMPHDESRRGDFLWDTFAKKPEAKQFKSYTTDNWKDNFHDFAKTLVQNANDQGFSAESLSKVLDLVLKHSNGKIAYLPIGAYQTTLDGSPIWIIIVKWEYPSKEVKLLGHVRMFAFDQRTLKQVAFNTCT